MDKDLMYTALCVGLVLMFANGFIFGKMWERLKWNELIKQGILPKPRKNDYVVKQSSDFKR